MGCERSIVYITHIYRAPCDPYVSSRRGTFKVSLLPSRHASSFLYLYFTTSNEIYGIIILLLIVNRYYRFYFIDVIFHIRMYWKILLII